MFRFLGNLVSNIYHFIIALSIYLLVAYPVTVIFSLVNHENKRSGLSIIFIIIYLVLSIIPAKISYKQVWPKSIIAAALVIFSAWMTNIFLVSAKQIEPAGIVISVVCIAIAILYAKSKIDYSSRGRKSVTSSSTRSNSAPEFIKTDYYEDQLNLDGYENQLNADYSDESVDERSGYYITASGSKIGFVTLDGRIHEVAGDRIDPDVCGIVNGGSISCKYTSFNKSSVNDSVIRAYSSAYATWRPEDAVACIDQDGTIYAGGWLHGARLGKMDLTNVPNYAREGWLHDGLVSACYLLDL